MKARAWILGLAAVAACSGGTGPADGMDGTDGGDPGDVAVVDGDGGGPMCQATTATPGPRGDAVGVVDPETGALWVVGGDVGPTVMCRTQPEFAADVWRYEPECDRWTELTLAGGPSARGRAAAALDTRRRRLVMFGGRFRAGTMGDYTVYNEVWALDLAQERWERIETTGTAPSARANASAVYDAEADELVVFGGNTSRSGLRFTPQADTWALNLETRVWQRRTTTGTAPSARLFHAAAIRGRQMLVFGGGDANAFTGPFLADAFALDLATGSWAPLTLTGEATEGRISHALVADPTTERFLLIAGHDDGQLGNRNDVLAVTPAGAVSILRGGDTFNRPGAGFCDFPPDFATIDMESPERRSAFVAALDARRGRVLVFGGKTDCGTANDVWALELATGSWRPLRTTAQGVACQRSGRADCTSLCN